MPARTLCILCCCWLACLTLRGESAFWVWNRAEVLTAQEKTDLQTGGVKTLYWHFAEIENKAGTWEWKRAPRLPEKSSASLRIVPVLRLEASVAEPFAEAVRTRLKEKVAAAFQTTGADEWQLDYDAPDRLVGAYADFLAELRPQAPKLSSTALAGWVRLPAFQKLRGSVAELCPMFYDLNPDTADALRPLMERESTQALVREWTKSCDIPWRAGLPWFARVTIYGANGKSRGHFRQWSWEDVIFKRGLHVEAPLKDGVTVLRATDAMALGRSAILKDERLVLRWPDRETVVAMEKAAARNVIFFRLPNGAAASGWSLKQFAARDQNAGMKLALRRDGGRLVLVNEGSMDLPPRVVGDGPQDRGYAVEVDAEAAVFREALPGDFWRVGGHREPESDHPKAVPVETATRLTFWFAALPAGQSLNSGLFQLTPAAEAAPLRYRVLNVEKEMVWQALGHVP